MKRNLLMLLSCSLLLISCGGEDTPVTPDNDSTARATEIVENDMVESDFDWEDLELPTPHQMARMLDIDSLMFDAALMNSPDNRESYASNSRKAFNLGCYSSDLSYAIITNSSDNANGSLGSMGFLASDLGMESVFNSTERLTTFQQNLGDREALMDFMDTLEDDIDTYAEENDLLYTETMIYAGGWIESMYIAGSHQTTLSSEELESRLVKHMMILDNLLPALKAIPEKDDFMNGMIAGLDDVKETFKNFEIISSIGEEGSDDASVSPEEWQSLHEKISDVRSNMVSP